MPAFRDRRPGRASHGLASTRAGRAGAVAAALAAVAAGAAALLAAGDSADPCAGAGLSHGSTAGDGVAFAVVPRGCSRGRGARCTVADARGAIATEVVEIGAHQDCVAFSQFVGAGVASGAAAGECGRRARVVAAGAARTGAAARGCPSEAPRGALPLRPARPAASIEARARDPHRRPPAARRRRGPRAPDWAVLVWRDPRSGVCHEAGQVIDARRHRELAAVYAGARQGEGLRGRIVGSLRPDAKFGVGRQFFDLGRFLPYPVAEGGSCGDPVAGAGLVASRELLAERPDLGPARTVVSGVAGPRVRAVELGAGADRRRLPLSARRAFLAVVRGAHEPAALPLTIVYRDGRRLALGRGEVR